MKSNLRNNLVVLLFFVSALMMLVLSVFTSFMMNSFSGYMFEDIEERLLAVGRSAAREITAEELSELNTPEDMEKPLFGQLRERLVAFAEDYNVIFVYYMRETDDGMSQFIIDNDLTEDTVNLAVDPIEMEEKPRQAFEGTVTITDLKNYSVGFDGLLSVFAPVYDSDGRVVAVAGADISDEQMLAVRSQIRTLIALLLICMLIVLTCGLLNVLLHRKKDRERLEALDNAVQASKAKGDFLSNMSHEMRTPMNAIIGMTTIGKTAGEIDRKNYCFDRITEASTHLLGVINDILDMSKIEANKLTLSSAPFHFDEMISKVVNINNYKVEEKRQNFTVEIDANIPNELIGDDQRLAQVVANLLSNAVKFTPEQGTIKLCAELLERDEKSCAVNISVADSGIGISPEQQARLFSSFSQADSSTSRKFGGTGLGLAISKQIVEMMGGEIKIDSELGRGATFSFSVRILLDTELPAAEAEDSTIAISGVNEAATFEGRRILIAEDIEINREIVEALLEPTLVEVDFALDGREAYDAFAAAPEKYDMIFMDVQMPELNGYEATEKIRGIGTPKAKEIPIVAMTANVFREDIEKCLASGMNDHVGKPIDIGVMIEKMRIYLTDQT